MTQNRDRRQFGRRKTDAFGWILVPGRSPLCCRVLNISVKGAYLELEKPPWLPGQFKLILDGIPEQQCELRHLYAGGIGVAFVENIHETHVEAVEGPVAPKIDTGAGARRR